VLMAREKQGKFTGFMAEKIGLLTVKIKSA
jgi:hypothetical protein